MIGGIKMLLNGTVLKDFMHNFYGYGNYDSDLWFIGIEEGGGNDIGEVEKRLNVWKDRGSKELEDLFEYHMEIGIDKYFKKGPVKQKTWSKLIHLILSYHNRESGDNHIRGYQKDRLGRADGESCLMELLPLPSPGNNSWNYDTFSNMEMLKTHEIYRDAIANHRVRNIRKKINEHRPRNVIFYAKDKKYINHWLDIIDLKGVPIEHAKESFIFIKENNTNYIITKHPTAYGVSNEHYAEIGRFLREKTR